ncbi:hypothetical protein DFH28DRAFT_884969, partial [Melampsora americana]
QHKAANNQQTGNTWRAAAETGVMGMGCRHDNLLALISINTGEASFSLIAYYAMALIDWLLEQTAEAVQGQDYKCVGVLYNIGCNFEKGIVRVSLSIRVSCKYYYLSIDYLFAYH